MHRKGNSDSSERSNQPVVVATRQSVVSYNLLMTRDPRGEVSAA